MGRNEHLVLWFSMFHVSIIAGIFDTRVEILDVIWCVCIYPCGNIVVVRKSRYMFLGAILNQKAFLMFVI